MRKSSKTFTFHYPLRHKVVCDLKIVTEQVGDLVVEGTGYFDASASTLDIFDRFAVDIDFVKWNGNDIKPILNIAGMMDEITEAAVRFVAETFETRLKHAA